MLIKTPMDQQQYAVSPSSPTPPVHVPILEVQFNYIPDTPIWHVRYTDVLIHLWFSFSWVSLTLLSVGRFLKFYSNNQQHHEYFNTEKIQF